MASKRPSLLKRIGIAAVFLIAAVFAVEGGEFGTTDLVRQRREKARIQRSIDSLSHVVDSLRKYEDKVRRDPATQERLAREVFGMVRGSKEIVYRFAEPIDSMRRKP